MEVAGDWLPAGTKENHKTHGRTAGVSNKICTILVPNTSLECSHLHQQTQCHVVLTNLTFGALYLIMRSKQGSISKCGPLLAL